MQPSDNQPIQLTESDKVILKAMNDTAFWDQVLGGQNFVYLLGSFSNKRDYSSGEWMDPYLFYSFTFG